LNPPDYAISGWPEEEFGSRFQSTVEVKPHEARQKMRAACSLARHVMDTVAWALEPGVTTEELDRICHAVTVGNGAYPSPLNYMGFPKSLCTSVNEVVCHGIPDARPLEEGDIVNLDITVRLNGYHGDLNETYYVGKSCAKSQTAQKLMDCTRKALEKAIAYCRPGRRFRDLGEIIAEEASRGGYASVKDFCGHGIGQLFHCAPNVPHYARNKAIGVMKEGMTFTIEPMFNESSSHKVVHWPDGWTAVTTNGARSAQYEHTLLITSDGVEVLTARTKNSRPFIA
jgi:methionyl aminopeptidase